MRVNVMLSGLVGAALAVASGMSAQETTANQFQTAVVSTAQIGGSATIGGTVIPFKEVTISAQIPGAITSMAGLEGTRVAEGEILITVDDADIVAQRNAALARVYQAQAGLQNAQMQYTRELYSPRSNSVSSFPGMGVPSMFDQFFTRGFSDAMGQSNSALERQADLYAQTSGVDQAQSGVMQAQAMLEALDVKLRDATHLAPFDGVIIQRMVEVGDSVQPGMPMLKFAYTDYLRVEADVPVRLAAGLTEGVIVQARLDIGGATIEARVAQIFPVADQARHTVKIKFDLPYGTPGGPGMYVEVTVPDTSIPVQGQAAVPTAALVWRGSLPSVFVLIDGKPSLRLVRVGYPIGTDRVSVISGLSGGETVILNPPATLVSGGN
ncbi:MAG: efflux RND transporter periplasmic adaptor subunit [Rhodobacteraceae bacterium]|nr:efflux RND transporter periplasmic adaptor subunit [Paracoccaceae bacterium]